MAAEQYDSYLVEVDKKKLGKIKEHVKGEHAYAYTPELANYMKEDKVLKHKLDALR